MRDVHCHILPGVDDGSRSLEESLEMIEEAKRAGVTSIICTPHCRDPWFDYDAMWAAFRLLKAEVDKQSMAPRMVMGFEVNYKKLMELGMEWADYLASETGEFLLELPTGTMPADVERIVFELQGRGYTVIIAHPERYRYVQDDIDVVRRFIQSGCKIQVSADFWNEGAFSAVKKTAKKLLDEGLVHYIASDAHGPSGYRTLKEVRKAYKPVGAHART